MVEPAQVATCLWFEREAEEAAHFYVSLLKGARITGTTRYGKGAPMPEGLALTVELEICGQRYVALNGGPHFKLSEAVSIVVDCETQAEIDELWERLSEGGAKSRCGWLKDRYGLSWQVVPAELKRMMRSGEPARIGRMFEALLQMDKLDIARLKAAYEGA